MLNVGSIYKQTYLLLWILSTSANRDVQHLCNTTKNCIWYLVVHVRTESHLQYHEKLLQYLVLDIHEVDNSLSDRRNRLDHCCQEFLSQGQHHDRPGNNLIILFSKVRMFQFENNFVFLNYKRSRSYLLYHRM